MPNGIAGPGYVLPMSLNPMPPVPVNGSTHCTSGAAAGRGSGGGPASDPRVGAAVGTGGVGVDRRAPARGEQERDEEDRECTHPPSVSHVGAGAGAGGPCYDEVAERSGRSMMRGVVPTFLIALLLVLASSTRADAQEGPPAVPPGYETASPPVAPESQPIVVVPAYGAQPQPTAQGVMPAAPIAPGAPLALPRARAVEVERSESIRALWLPGLIALPVAWLSTWTAASTYFVGDALTYAWIPVIGPWLMLTQDLNGFEAPVVISGIVQGAATLMIVLGLSLRRTYTATEYVYDPPAVTFDVAPMPGGGYGSVTFRL